MAQPLTPKGPEKPEGSETPVSRFAGPFEDFRGEIDRLFDSFFGGFLTPRMGGMARQTDVVMPIVDVREDDKCILVEAELPGLDEKEIEVTLREHLLTISGEKKAQTEEQHTNYHLMERRYGSFQRVLRLPETVDVSKIEAVFERGVLKITMPKKPESQREHKKIEVKSGGGGS